MPDPENYENEKEFMAACVPALMEEGRENEQAVAACSSMWKRRGEKPEEKAFDNALKAVVQSPFELVVENHIVLFGGRDLTGYAYGPNDDGSLGEYFTKSTNFDSDYTKTGMLYVDFEHGRDPDQIGNDPNKILGYVDWKTARTDDEGVIVRRVLNRRHEYMKWLEPLIQAGLVGNSTQAIQGKAKKTEKGELVEWPLQRDTLTFTPMEPRMLDQNIMTAVKAMAEDIPYYKSIVPADIAALTETADKPKQVETNQGKGIEKESIMDEKENGQPTAVASFDEAKVAEVAAKAVAAALAEREAAQQAEAQKAADLKAAEEEGYKKALEDLKENRVTPKYHTTDPTDDDSDGVQAFKHWMFTGQRNQSLMSPQDEYMKAAGSYYVGNEGKAAWNVADGATGGYLVPDPLYQQIIAKRNIASWVRQVPCQYFTTPAEHLLVPRENTSMTDFVLTAEAGTYDENEGNVSQKDLILYKYTKLTKMSEEFLMYQGTNWESWFANALGRSVAGTENAIFTTGTGTSQPEGVVTGATVANTTATTDVILPSELTALVGYLGGGYNVSGECAFLMNNTTKWYLKGQGGTSYAPFAYVPTPQGGDFLGYPAIVDDDVVVYTTASAKCVVFGNMTYYAVVEKPGMIVQRNPYLYQATGQIGIFASIFRGGGVLQSEAFYYLTNAAS